MNSIISFISITLFLFITFFGSRHFYFTYLRFYTNNKLKHLGIGLADLKYSFEEITYVVTLPSYNTAISNCARESLRYKVDMYSQLEPAIKGVQIFIQSEDNRQYLVAYLRIDSFRLPLLDRYLFEGRIDTRTYETLSSYILIHPNTMQEILNEVHLQLQSNRFV